MMKKFMRKPEKYLKTLKMKLNFTTKGSPARDSALLNGRGPRPRKGAPLGHLSCPNYNLLVYSNLITSVYVYLIFKEIHIKNLFLSSLSKMEFDVG